MQCTDCERSSELVSRQGNDEKSWSRFIYIFVINRNASNCCSSDMALCIMNAQRHKRVPAAIRCDSSSVAIRMKLVPKFISVSSSSFGKHQMYWLCMAWVFRELIVFAELLPLKSIAPFHSQFSFAQVIARFDYVTKLLCIALGEYKTHASAHKCHPSRTKRKSAANVEIQGNGKRRRRRGKKKKIIWKW